jgi:hypothetical protein
VNRFLERIVGPHVDMKTLRETTLETAKGAHTEMAKQLLDELRAALPESQRAAVMNRLVDRAVSLGADRFWLAQYRENAPVHVQNERQIPTSASRETPWFQHRGTLETMSQTQQNRAREYYENWPHKERFSFEQYVGFTLKQHQQPRASDRVGEMLERHNGREREVELSR